MRATYRSGGHSKQDHSAAVAEANLRVEQNWTAQQPGALTELVHHPAERMMLPVLDLDPAR